MAFVSSFAQGAVSTSFSGARVSLNVSRPVAAKVTMMSKSKAVPFMDTPPALEAPCPGNNGFDILGFTNFFPLAWMQEAEIKHGRICMLATIGFLVEEIYRFPFYSGAPKLLVDTHDWAVSAGPLWQLLIFLGIFETVAGFPAISQTLQGSPRKPGDFGFDPLGLGKPESFAKYQEAEIINGRLAMVAIGGFVHQEWLTKMNTVEQLTHGKFLPPL
eukprot:Plantae.Rhodophyta-Rhodochaete_pulchella.ctg10666.p1 GENE.Plantae.Rhodophyta-Rhodochaete_pulchella.ctg10666~~Plantae.Rhodophyta-Rhodochaete_pulchella.ctg10666.p1  ORF type:complete len:216 (+),score=29.09 Plantae.Rhodophyta-Rhodochaete_pulchella.ctg10666:162-809(+)